jgi:hypothetical protein
MLAAAEAMMRMGRKRRVLPEEAALKPGAVSCLSIGMAAASNPALYPADFRWWLQALRLSEKVVFSEPLERVLPNEKYSEFVGLRRAPRFIASRGGADRICGAGDLSEATHCLIRFRRIPVAAAPVVIGEVVFFGLAELDVWLAPPGGAKPECLTDDWR